MKIKVIDLLNKIANGEEVPNKIKYRNKIWEYTSIVKGRGYQYYSVMYEEWKTLQNQVYLEECLNDEVEIIEEPKKIEYPILHKIAPSETTGDQMPNWRNLIDCNFKYLNKTICQLIDKINKLKEK